MIFFLTTILGCVFFRWARAPGPLGPGVSPREQSVSAFFSTYFLLFLAYATVSAAGEVDVVAVYLDLERPDILGLSIQ